MTLTKKDRYGRLVGVAIVYSHDVNLEQVRAGFAWWYPEYAKEQPPDCRRVSGDNISSQDGTMRSLSRAFCK